MSGEAALVAYDRLTYVFHTEPTPGHGAVDSSVDCWHCRSIIAAIYPDDAPGGDSDVT